VTVTRETLSATYRGIISRPLLIAEILRDRPPSRRRWVDRAHGRGPGPVAAADGRARRFSCRSLPRAFLALALSATPWRSRGR
jgi:hypothetical protein